MWGKGGAPIGTKRRNRRVDCQESQLPEDGAPDGEAGGAGGQGDAIQQPARRKRARPVRRKRKHADSRPAKRPARVPDGDRPAVLRRDRRKVGKTHRPKGKAKPKRAKRTVSKTSGKKPRAKKAKEVKPSNPMSLRALPVRKLLELLQQSGSKHATEEAIAADIAVGAPVNPDGTVDLIIFAAWLVREGNH